MKWIVLLSLFLAHSGGQLLGGDTEPPCPHKFQEEGSTTVKTGSKVNYKNFQPVSENEFRFRVQAPRYARVILTTQPEDSKPDYEIVLGGYYEGKGVRFDDENRFRCFIRKNRRWPDKVMVRTNVLNSGELRGFWINFEGGNITVGKECEDTPFMSYEDPQPINVTYAGISTGAGANGTFLLEAPDDE